VLQLNILSCGVIGAFLVVQACDWFLLGGVRHLIVNAFRKSAIPGFTEAYCTMPFQMSGELIVIGLKHTMLLVVWQQSKASL
jgi:hypothetical protein